MSLGLESADAVFDHVDSGWTPARQTGEVRAQPRPGPAAARSLESGLREAAMRSFDIVTALAMLIAALPFLVLVSIALQIDSPGRLFFAHWRVGKGGKMFPCLKFRTM